MAASSEKGVIRAQALAKHYDAKVAVQDVSLTLQGGEIVGLLGPNGAGKTTSLRILATLLAPDSGLVRVAGLDALVDPRGVRERLGYVAQEVALDKILSGRELLQLQGDLYHLSRADRDQRIAELIGLLAMEEWMCSLIRSTSILLLDSIRLLYW